MTTLEFQLNANFTRKLLFEKWHLLWATTFTHKVDSCQPTVKFTATYATLTPWKFYGQLLPAVKYNANNKMPFKHYRWINSLQSCVQWWKWLSQFRLLSCLFKLSKIAKTLVRYQISSINTASVAAIIYENYESLPRGLLTFNKVRNINKKKFQNPNVVTPSPLFIWETLKRELNYEKHKKWYEHARQYSP